MTVAWLTPTPVQRFTDNDGNALVGGKVFTYLGGTTTKTPVYTDSTGTTAFPNPIILNARGEPAVGTASAGIWLTPGVAYKFVLSPADDTDPPTAPIWTVDNVLVQLPIYWPKVNFPGTPGNGAFIWGDYVVGTINYPANFAGSRFYCHVAPTATYVITVQKNGVTVGTITFTIGTKVGVLVTSGGLAVAGVDGDRFELLGQSTADATIAGIYGTFKGTRLF